MRTSMCGKQYNTSENKDFACSYENEPDLRASKEGYDYQSNKQATLSSPSAWGMIILLRQVSYWLPGRKKRRVTD